MPIFTMFPIVPSRFLLPCLLVCILNSLILDSLESPLGQMRGQMPDALGPTKNEITSCQNARFVRADQTST
jgi:hypothetical protein